MPTVAIIQADTRDILVLNPPRDDNGKPIKPEGIDCFIATLSDTEMAKFSDQASYKLAEDGTVEVTPVEAVVDKKAEQRAADLELVGARTKNDPVFAALLRVLGVEFKWEDK